MNHCWAPHSVYASIKFIRLTVYLIAVCMPDLLVYMRAACCRVCSALSTQSGYVLLQLLHLSVIQKWFQTIYICLVTNY